MRLRGWSIAASLLAGLVLAAHPCPAEARDKVRLQLRWQHQFQFAGYYVALDRGYYREAGLDVELVEARPGLEPVNEVVSQRAHYGVGTSELVVARAAGKPVVALAPIYQHSPLILVSLRGAGIDSVHDLRGKRVAMEHEAADLIAYLRREGLRAAQIELVPHAQDVRALLDRQVDAMSAYLTDEPFALAAAGHELREFSPRAGGIDFYGDTLFTSERELGEHPERVRAFVDASLRGFREAMREPEQAIDLILARTKRHSREHLRFEAERTIPLVAADIVELGYTNPGRWESIAGVYASLGLMPGGFKLDGFLYRPEARKGPPTWLLLALGGASLLALAIAAGWVRAFRLARVLGRERARWQAFVEASPQPTLIVGEAGHVRYQNPRARSAFGELPVLEAALAREDVAEHLARARRGEALHDLELALDIADETRWLSLSAAACDSDGERCLLLCFADVSGRKAVEDTLRREAETDVLTGAFNRRRVLSFLAQARGQALDLGEPLSVGIFDVDRFKTINDGEGHAVGDRVLERLSGVAREELRKDDVLGRLGGDEFVFVLPDTTEHGAMLVAERLRERVHRELRVVDGRTLSVTVSIGLSTLLPDEELDHLLARADTALYRAKAEGRNRVSAYGRPSTAAATEHDEDGRPERQQGA